MNPKLHPHALASTLAIPFGFALAMGLAACSDDGGQQGNDTDAEIDTCFSGSEGCPCAAENTCDPGLVCVSGGCVNLRGSSSCGNGNLDPGEECDLGVFNEDEGSCKSDCTLQRCGDGVVGMSEACDDGNDLDTDDCTSSCAFASCGDGVVQTIEECDDANESSTDDCLGTCLFATCGDGFVREGVEECDDANDIDGDGCESDCTNTVVTTCGNASDDPGELCFTQTNLLAGKAPTRPILTDVDGDGELDIAVANTDSDDVWIWLGDGSGGFADPVEVGVGVAPVGLAVVDFDGDGEIDLATAGAGDDTLTIAFGTGTLGTYDLVARPLGGTPVAVGSFNLSSDATEDVIVSIDDGLGGGQRVEVVRGTGSQILPFPAVTTNPAELFDEGTAAAFTDGNVVGGNSRYIVASDTEHSRVRALFVETPNNILQSPDGAFSLPLAIRPHGVAAGDLNDDGAEDVVTANWNRDACNYAFKPNICGFDTVSVVFGDAAASAALFVGKQDYAVGKAPWDPVIADFDGDGDPDIGTANGYSGTISVLDNDGGGTFSPARTYRFGPSAETVYVAATELNGDGRADLVIVRRAMNTISVLLSNP